MIHNLVNFEPLDQEKLFSVAFQHPMGRSKYILSF